MVGYQWMMNPIFTKEMVGNHQTSIYKWLFGVPGISLYLQNFNFAQVSLRGIRQQSSFAKKCSMVGTDRRSENIVYRWSPYRRLPM